MPLQPWHWDPSSAFWLFADIALFMAFMAWVVVSLPLMVWWNIAPIDLSRLYGDLTIQGALLRPVLRVELNLAYWIWGGVALVATALLAALYPAARAARIPPADALSGL